MLASLQLEVIHTSITLSYLMCDLESESQNGCTYIVFSFFDRSLSMIIVTPLVPSLVSPHITCSLF